MSCLSPRFWSLEEAQSYIDNFADKTTLQAEEQQPLQKRRRTNIDIVQSEKLRHVEDDCAEGQVSSREDSNDQDDPKPIGIVIVGQYIERP